MTSSAHHTSWQDYCEHELAQLRPLLSVLGITLDETQVHIGGERAVISGKKIVLLGTRSSDGKRVVIKASSTAEGKQEMEREYVCRTLLDQLPFSYKPFLSPPLLEWRTEGPCLISITAFLPQEQAFLERSFNEQFFLAMKAFEAQEGTHATTYEHLKQIRGTFRVFETHTYLERVNDYRETVAKELPHERALQTTLKDAETLLRTQHKRIEQYNGFLAHGDFVPHNIRVVGRDIYLLDHYDLRFGNKYDGWARFLNFMLLYHRELEQALLRYVQQNRSHEEWEALHLMRVYRFAELIWYYTTRLHKSTGDLLALDRARIFFWNDALRAELEHASLSPERIATYQALRDQLRSPEEKQRQKGLH